MINIRKAYTFDDVLLVPKKTNLNSRDEVDLSVDLGKGIKINKPIISANMKTVTGPILAAKLADIGGMAILHRFTEDRIKDYEDAKSLMKTDNKSNIGVSIGIQDGELEFVDRLVGETYCKILCLDIAHAHSDNCIRLVEKIAAKHSNLLLIAGNVATVCGARDLVYAGADVVKVGIGSGAICSTRIQTGNGVPQLTAISDIAEEFETRNIKAKIISDGGIKAVGSICKALCFADAVMLGTMLAGTDEAPGRLIEDNGVRYKEYIGSSTYKSRYIEGIASKVISSGPLETVVETICDGVRSCCSYQGVRNLDDLKLNPNFVEITNSGLIESMTHKIIK